MKKRSSLLAVILLITVIVFGTVSANAQEIIFTGEACPLTVYVDAKQFSEIQIESMNVLGIMDGEYAVVLYKEAVAEEAKAAEEVVVPAAAAPPAPNGQAPAAPAEPAAAQSAPAALVGYISVEELAEKVPSLDISSLPTVEKWTNLVNGSSGDKVLYLQERLIELGFLAGAADGKFGPRTQASVNAFLESVGLPQTNAINAAAWFLLQDDGTSEPKTVAYPPVFTVEDKYASILDVVSDASVLEGFTDRDWKFSYDAFDRQGVITRDLEMEPFVIDDKAIDRISIELELALYLRAGADGQINIIPALLLCSTGAYRPYFQTVSLNCNGTVVDLSVLASDSSIERTNVIEESYIALTAEACEAILTMGDDTSLEARLRGVNRSYDMDLSSIAGEIREFAQNVSGVFAE